MRSTVGAELNVKWVDGINYDQKKNICRGVSCLRIMGSKLAVMCSSTTSQ